MPLCERCLQIRLDPGWKTLLGSPNGQDRWQLGTYGEVRRRNCPLCRLAAAICVQGGTSWHSLAPLEDGREVELRLVGSRFVTQQSRLGTELCLVGDSANGDVYGARTDFDEWIDLKEVARWIARCDEKHPSYGHECLSRPFDLAALRASGSTGSKRGFRVIDVVDMRLVDFPPQSRFVALSYVWGAPSRERLTLTTRNEPILSQHGILEAYRHMIPNTIMDAMSVARVLGMRYLWVDSLCLLQDDKDELQEFVDRMDLIYDMAAFTIIAAGGDDAFSGIHGIPPTTRKVERVIEEIVPGLKMSIVDDVDTIMRSVVYTSRAWT